MAFVLQIALLLGGLLCGAETAHAQSSTHALAELELGAALSGDGGPAAAISLGVGGMLRGFPARFYLLGRFGVSAYAAGVNARLAPAGLGTERGEFRDLALGPRVYLPLWGGLRWYADALVGASHVSGSFDAPGRASLQAQQWLALLSISSGLQLRVSRAVSLGVRAGFSFNESGLTGVMRSAGVHAPVRSSLGGGATWHF